MSFLFKTAQTQDLKSLADLVNSAYRGESSKQGWTTEADLLGGQRTDPDQLQELLQGSTTEPPSALPKEIQILWENEKPQACFFIRKESQSLAYLGMLTVSPELQGKQIGKLLLSEAEKIARNWGCNEIRMTVIDRRLELIAYYERRGYFRTGSDEPFPEVDPRFGIPKVQGLRLIELRKKLDLASHRA